MRENLFCGCATALVTPFHGQRVDYDGLEALIDRQIDEGIDALVVLGTTGEPCTITDSERSAIIECAVSRCARRVPLIVGTGSNCTSIAENRAREAMRMGADAILSVTPYYNRGSVRGIEEHFRRIADSIEIPMILYDVPTRTGVHLPPESAASLAVHPMISGYKAAHGSISEALRLFELAGSRLQIYCGNDDMILPMLALGACGAISVASNVIPSRMHEMCVAFMRGEVGACREAQIGLLPLIRAMSMEVNPIPVKAALALMGKCENTLRLPLMPLSDAQMNDLAQVMKGYHLIG